MSSHSFCASHVSSWLACCVCLMATWHLPTGATAHALRHLPPADAGTLRMRSNVEQQLHPNPHAPFLPATPQTNDNTMLLMINSYTFNASTSRVPATLDNAVSWCDLHNQDVHIVLYTASPALADYVLARDTRYFCRRTGRPLPVAVLEYDANITVNIAGMHRYLVSRVVDDYAWFLYSEDDIAYRWSHIDYLRRWSTALHDTTYAPHLMRYEVMPLAGAPRPALVLDDHPLPLTISKVPHITSPLITLLNPYMALWHLPRADVRRYVARPNWHADIAHCPSADPRVYFATFWLLPHVNLTVPADDAREALVQHVSTHYVTEAAAAVVHQREHGSHPRLLHQWYNTDALDLVADVGACIGHRGAGLLSESATTADRQADTNAHDYIQRLGRPVDGECRRCLDAGQAARVECADRRQGVPLMYAVTCV